MLPVWHTHKKIKIAAIHSITWHFGQEDLVRTKLLIIVGEKSLNKAFYIFSTRKRGTALKTSAKKIHESILTKKALT